MVTLDVSFLYTNISHQDAVDTIRCIFSLAPPSPYRPPIFILTDLLIFLFLAIIFSFNQEIFVQLHGIARGTKLAPSLATLFLSITEEDHISNSPFKPSLWKRYIDNIFFVWEDTRESLDIFISGLNSFQPRLKFTADISSTSAVFFWTLLFIKVLTLPPLAYSRLRFFIRRPTTFPIFMVPLTTLGW